MFGSDFHNYKHYFSIASQGVADVCCKFLTIGIGAAGTQSVFRNSDLYLCLETNSFNVPTCRRIP